MEESDKRLRKIGTLMSKLEEMDSQIDEKEQSHCLQSLILKYSDNL